MVRRRSPRDSFANRFRIGGIVLVTFDVVSFRRETEARRLRDSLTLYRVGFAEWEGLAPGASAVDVIPGTRFTIPGAGAQKNDPGISGAISNHR
jgi:hypothetical protein